MPSRPALLVAWAVLALCAGTAPAQDRSAAIDDPAWGLRFTPPAGWTRRPAPEGYLFVSPQGLLAVLPHDARTVDVLRAEAEHGLADAHGTRLRAQGPLEAFGTDGLAADFAGQIEGAPARARVIGRVSPHGRGATILAAAAPEQYDASLGAVAEAVARSIVFTAPPARAATGSEDAEWREFLQGCRLSAFERYDSGGGGYSDETVVDLCPGYFTFRDRSTTIFNETDPVSGSDPVLHRDARSAGQWRAARRNGQAVLELRFHDGTVRAYPLDYRDGRTFLDGRRWLRTCNPADPVVEARPQCR